MKRSSTGSYKFNAHLAVTAVGQNLYDSKFGKKFQYCGARLREIDTADFASKVQVHLLA